jgi:hypothetical protein
MCLLELDMEELECCHPTALAGLQCTPLHQIGAAMCANNSLWGVLTLAPQFGERLPILETLIRASKISFEHPNVNKLRNFFYISFKFLESFAGFWL